jgi:hypothetical protein
MKALLVLLALLVSVPASAQALSPAPYLVLTVGSAVDLGTTLQALHSGRGQEGNPFLSHGGDAGLIAGKVVSTAALLFVMRQIGLKGHPRIAAVIGYAGGAALAGLGARNAQVGR